MMAALYTFGAIQAVNGKDRHRLERLVGMGLAEPAARIFNTYRLTVSGSAWVARQRGTTAPAADPVEESRKRLDRGLGIADDQAA